jgi:hypothetical protein
MSKMSDLDLMVREGDRTAEDFIKRGIDARTARAMADVVKASNVEPVDSVLGEGKLANDIAGDRVAREDSAFGHGPGCYGECDGEYDCSEPPAYLPARHPHRRHWSRGR